MQTDANGTPILVDDETGEVLATAFFKTPYNHDRNAESDRTGTMSEGQSETEQSFRDEADINLIIKRVMQGQEHDLVLPEHFGDGTERLSYLDMQLLIAKNNAAFYNLAPEIRGEFKNDPGAWADQVEKDLVKGDEENLKRMGIDMTGWTKVIPEQNLRPPAGTPAPAATETAPAPAAAVKPPSGAT